jgi:hypothetical protein
LQYNPGGASAVAIKKRKFIDTVTDQEGIESQNRILEEPAYRSSGVLLVTAEAPSPAIFFSMLLVLGVRRFKKALCTKGVVWHRL